MARATERENRREKVSFTLLQTSRAHLPTAHRLESRMREICQSGSEGGEGESPSLPHPEELGGFRERDAFFLEELL